MDQSIKFNQLIVENNQHVSTDFMTNTKFLMQYALQTRRDYSHCLPGISNSFSYKCSLQSSNGYKH